MKTNVENSNELLDSEVDDGQSPENTDKEIHRLLTPLKAEDDEIDTEVTIEMCAGFKGEKNHITDSNTKNGRFKTHRYFHTICVFCSMFAIGWRNGLNGPAFPDLQLIMKADLGKASWVFTGMSIGGLFGTVTSGYAYDRLRNHRLQMMASVVFGFAVTTAIAPWCVNFASMFVIHVLYGVFHTAIDTVMITDVAAIWGEDAGTNMQALHLFFSVGAFLSPFTAAPFLAPIHHPPGPICNRSLIRGNDSFNLSSMGTFSWKDETANAIQVPFIDSPDDIKSTKHVAKYDNVIYNGSHSLLVKDDADKNITAVFSDGSTTDISNGTGDVTCSYETDVYFGETKIFITYLISAGISCLSACSFLIVLFRFGSIHRQLRANFCSNDHLPERKKYILSTKEKHLFTIILASVLAMYNMSERGLSYFLMSFVTNNLSWTKSQGAGISSMFWIAFSVGRFLAVFTVKYFSNTKSLLINFVISLIGCSLLWVAVILNIDALVWVAIASTCFGLSGIFSSIFAWQTQYVRPLTGRVASCFFFVIAISAIPYPVFLGYLMDTFSQNWYIYSSFILFCCMSLSFVIILIYHKILVIRRQ
ncbi:sodium-dependent glucose transporter 1-like [Mya arenaria]|uniref:sodium-dependent glucose transporter 1-like n=1 Tax=Mya arenaria TaxID=6604 RepID=UPI0022E55986|nr:sodium-dependent glucose transporter 1-like [Mya arenaria]